MFFRKAKEIEDLKFLLSIFYERNKSQTDLIRVHVNTNRRLKKEIMSCIRVGRANVLTTRDIARMTNLSVRRVRDGIAELRLNYSVPIVASRSLPRGYYFAENDDEYTAWVLQYKKQIKTEQKLLDSLKSTSWDHYKKIKKEIKNGDTLRTDRTIS